MMDDVTRPLIVPDIDENGLINQPDFGDDLKAWADFELVENHRRDGAAVLADYANVHGNGRARGVDPKGDYPCGACNRHVDNDDSGAEKTAKPCCTLLPRSFVIDLKRGSCKKWEDWCAGDPETFFAKIRKLGQYTAEILGYGVALVKRGRDGKGFGCKRCSLQEPAIRKDSRGRPIFCRWWGARVDLNDCCGDNDAPSTEYDGNEIIEGGAADKDDEGDDRRLATKIQAYGSLAPPKPRRS